MYLAASLQRGSSSPPDAKNSSTSWERAVVCAEDPGGGGERAECERFCRGAGGWAQGGWGLAGLGARAWHNRLRLLSRLPSFSPSSLKTKQSLRLQRARVWQVCACPELAPRHAPLCFTTSHGAAVSPLSATPLNPLPPSTQSQAPSLCHPEVPRPLRAACAIPCTHSASPN